MHVASLTAALMVSRDAARGRYSVGNGMLLALLLIGLIQFDTCRASDDTMEPLHAGTALRVVNPTRPAVTIGHRVMKKFDHVYADLRVQAMVVQDDDDQRIVWMAMDFCILRHEVVDHIKSGIEQAYGIPPEAVCINTSHTHSAPPLTVEEAVLPDHVDLQYSQHVLAAAVGVVGDAIARLEPSRLRYSYDYCDVGINRRRLVKGNVSMVPNPDGIIDRRVQVIAVESIATGKLTGVAVKYACHPVTVVGLGIGSDYPGFMRKIVEQRYPGVVALFLQGCGADVRIRAVNEDLSGWVDGDVALAERFGAELAAAVDRSLAKEVSDAVVVGGPVRAVYEEVRLPVDAFSLEQYQRAADSDNPAYANWGRRCVELMEQNAADLDTCPYRIQAFYLGPPDEGLTIVALDGEVFTEYGLNLEARLARGPFIALGYSNGVVTYIPTAQAMAEGGYEPSAFRYFLVPGPFPPSIEPQILREASRIAAGLAHRKE